VFAESDVDLLVAQPLSLTDFFHDGLSSWEKCAYCGTVRTAAVRDAVAAQERALFADDLDSEVFTERERLAVDLADRLSRDALSVDDAFFAALESAFTDAELVELLLFASLEVGLDRFCIALRLDTTEESTYPIDLGVSDGTAAAVSGVRPVPLVVSRRPARATRP
jgi:hypothetical protein